MRHGESGSMELKNGRIISKHKIKRELMKTCEGQTRKQEKEDELILRKMYKRNIMKGRRDKKTGDIMDG